MLKDSFWKKALNDPVEAGLTFKFLSSEPTRSSTLLSHYVYKTLFKDYDDDEGSVIGLRLILEMQIETEEVPMFDIIFNLRFNVISYLISGLGGSWLILA